MTESFADNGDGFAQYEFMEDKKDYQTHWLNDSYNSMYPANFPVPVYVDRSDSIGPLLHHLDIGMSSVRFC